MLDQNRSADPATHAICVTIARRCVGIIAPLLRPEEKAEALREFYLAIREELERSPARN